MTYLLKDVTHVCRDMTHLYVCMQMYNKSLSAHADMTHLLKDVTHVCRDMTHLYVCMQMYNKSLSPPADMTHVLKDVTHVWRDMNKFVCVYADVQQQFWRARWQRLKACWTTRRRCHRRAALGTCNIMNGWVMSQTKLSSWLVDIQHNDTSKVPSSTCARDLPWISHITNKIEFVTRGYTT